MRGGRKIVMRLPEYFDPDFGVIDISDGTLVNFVYCNFKEYGG